MSIRPTSLARWRVFSSFRTPLESGAALSWNTSPASAFALLGNKGARIVKRTFLTVIVFIAVIAFLALFLADREMQAGIHRLSNYTFSPRSALDANPGPSLATGRSGSTAPGR